MGRSVKFYKSWRHNPFVFDSKWFLYSLCKRVLLVMNHYSLASSSRRGFLLASHHLLSVSLSLWSNLATILSFASSSSSSLSFSLKQNTEDPKSNFAKSVHEIQEEEAKGIRKFSFCAFPALYVLAFIFFFFVFFSDIILIRVWLKFHFVFLSSFTNPLFSYSVYIVFQKRNRKDLSSR